jgi:hypothetical protein
VAFHPIGELGQLLLRVLQEVGRGAVSFQRGIVLVLLVNEEPP